jgi:hypothetical protein
MATSMGLWTLLAGRNRNGVADSAGCAGGCCRRQPAAAGVGRAVGGCHRQTAACGHGNSHDPGTCQTSRAGGHRRSFVLSCQSARNAVARESNAVAPQPSAWCGAGRCGRRTAGIRTGGLALILFLARLLVGGCAVLCVVVVLRFAWGVGFRAKKAPGVHETVELAVPGLATTVTQVVPSCPQWAGQIFIKRAGLRTFVLSVTLYPIVPSKH